jgi:hypothetical protein
MIVWNLIDRIPTIYERFTCMCEYDGKLYLGSERHSTGPYDYFTPPSNLYKLNDDADEIDLVLTLPQIGSYPTVNINSIVQSLCVYHDELYIMGGPAYHYFPNEWWPTNPVGSILYKLVGNAVIPLTPSPTNPGAITYRKLIVFNDTLLSVDLREIGHPANLAYGLFQFNGLDAWQWITTIGTTYETSPRDIIVFEDELYIYNITSLLKYDPGTTSFVFVADLPYTAYLEAVGNFVVHNDRLYLLQNRPNANGTIYRLNLTKDGFETLVTITNLGGLHAGISFDEKLYCSQGIEGASQGYLLSKLNDSENGVDNLALPLEQYSYLGISDKFDNRLYFGEITAGSSSWPIGLPASFCSVVGYIEIDSALRLATKRIYSIIGSEFGTTGLSAIFTDFDSVEHICSIEVGYTNIHAHITIPDEAASGLGSLTLTETTSVFHLGTESSDSIDITIIALLEIYSQNNVIDRIFDITGISFETSGLGVIFTDFDSVEHVCSITAGYTDGYARITVPPEASLGIGSLKLTNSHEEYDSINIEIVVWLKVYSQTPISYRIFDITGIDFGTSGLEAKFVDSLAVEHICTIEPGYTDEYAQITVPDVWALGVGTLTLTNADDESDSIPLENIRLDIDYCQYITGLTFDINGSNFGTSGLTATFLDSSLVLHSCSIEVGYTDIYARITIPPEASIGIGTLTLTSTMYGSDSIELTTKPLVIAAIFLWYGRTYDVYGEKFGTSGLIATYLDSNSVLHSCLIDPGYNDYWALVSVPHIALPGMGTLTLTNSENSSDNEPLELPKFLHIESADIVTGRTYDIAGIWFGTHDLVALFTDVNNDEYACSIESGYTEIYAQITIPLEAKHGVGSLKLINSDLSEDSIEIEIIPIISGKIVYNTLTYNYGTGNLNFHETEITQVNCKENTNPEFKDESIGINLLE